MENNQSKITQIGRIAFRQEGSHWCAYYALCETMEGADYLGSIHMGIAQIPAVRSAFIDVMRVALSHTIKNSAGIEVSWNEPEPAPEHERSGRA